MGKVLEFKKPSVSSKYIKKIEKSKKKNQILHVLKTSSKCAAHTILNIASTFTFFLLKLMLILMAVLAFVEFVFNKFDIRPFYNGFIFVGILVVIAGISAYLRKRLTTLTTTEEQK